jgi:hypothetical protein
MLMPQLVPMVPTGWEADATDEHPADFAFDEFSNTYWADQTDAPPVLTVNFGSKFDLGAVILTSGPKDEYSNFDRPKTVVLSFPDSDAKSITLTFDDLAETITKTGLDARGIETIEFRFVDFYPHDQEGDAVLAISDLQFQARR